MVKRTYNPIETIRQARDRKISGRMTYPVFISTLLKKKTPAGLMLGSIGGLLILASYLSSSVVLTFAGLGLILWAIIMFYAVRNDIPGELFVASSLTSMASIKNVMGGLGYDGTVIFFHPKSLEGLRKGYIFFAKDLDASIPAEAHQNTERIFFNSPDGILLAAPNQNLLDLVEERMGDNLATTEFGNLAGKLPSIVIEEFGLAKGMTIEEKGNTINIVLKGDPSVAICKTIREKSGNSKHFECPICSTFALVLSKVTGNPIVIVKSEGTSRTTQSTFRRLRY